MKQIMDSINTVVHAHNELDKRSSELVALFNDVLSEHCDYRRAEAQSCDHQGNELHFCCMASCPLGKTS